MYISIDIYIKQPLCWVRKNIVTMKFNMINWVLETFVNILILFDNSRLSTIIYILIMSGGTPLVYFMGIEENRKIAQEHFKSHIKIFKKKNQVQASTSNSTSVAEVESSL